MGQDIPEPFVRWRAAPRFVASRYPTVGLFDRVSAPADVEAVIELEGWTNDRIRGELGILSAVPRDEWVTGRAMSSVVMAPFCHPQPGGARFNAADRGAWYSARTLGTALAEAVHRRTAELREVGAPETRVEMRVYLADFSARFHDVRRVRGALARSVYDPDDYSASQALARRLLEAGSNGVVYHSVRDPGGECLACFRPRLVRNVRAGGHYEFRWRGTKTPVVGRL